MLQKYGFYVADLWENSKARQGQGNWIPKFSYKGPSLVEKF